MSDINEIHFGETHMSLSSYENLDWNLLETRFVEFFPNKMVPVTLVSTDVKDFGKYLNDVNDSEPIALDLEWKDELCLFQFCSSKGVLIVRHPDGPGNLELHNFLSSHCFFAKGASNDRKQLLMKFGDDYHYNIEDIALTRLIPYGHSENFVEMTHQFAGKPTAEFKDIRITTSCWSQKTLSMRQVLYAAFDVVAIYQCYPNFPPPKIIKKKVKKTQNKSLETKKIKKIKNKDEKETSSSSQKPKVIMKTNTCQPTFCYMITSYSGSTLRSDLYDLFGFLKPESINFITFFQVNESSSIVFISLLTEIDVSLNKINNLVSLPKVSFDESSDGDILFLTNLPKRIADRRELEKFLNCFEVDHRLLIKNEELEYVQVEVCSASSSYNLQCFVPFVQIEDHPIGFYRFPFFLNMVIVSCLPSCFTINDCENLFSKYGTIKSIEPLTRRSEDDFQSFKVRFNHEIEANSAIDDVNYREINGNEVLVSRFTNESHLRIMRRYELTVTTDSMKKGTTSKELREEYSCFGKIHQAYYDERLSVGHIQFYNKSDAISALSTKNVFFPLEGSSIIVRDISCAVPQNEIIEMCEKYGKVINFVVRLVIPKFRYQIVEVTYMTPEQAKDAKADLDNRKIDNLAIAVSIYRGAGSEVPMWKMEQRFKWIVVDQLIAERDVFLKLSKFGEIIDFRFSNDKNKTLVMFSDPRSAEAANEEICSHMPSLEEFVYETNNKDLQIEWFTPFKNPINEAQQYAIVLDPMPDLFSQQMLKEYCPKCFFKFATLRSTINRNKRRAVIYCDGQKMSKKIFALLRDQPCGEEFLKPIIMKKEEVPETSDKAPISIIIDPIPEELDSEGKIKTNILMDKEATIDIITSAIDPGKKMAVVYPKRKEDCKIILRKFRRWRVEGEPLNVQKIVNE